MNDPDIAPVKRANPLALPPPEAPRLDRVIVDRARRGDDAAFAVILAHHDPALRSLAGWLLGAAEVIDAALAETYLKAFRGLPRLSPGADTGPWLVRLTTITCLDRVRRNEASRRSATGDRVAAEAASSPVAAALAALPLDQRSIVILISAEGFDAAEVSDLLGLDQEAVLMRHRRAGSLLAAAAVADEDGGDGAGDQSPAAAPATEHAAADYLMAELATGEGATWLADELEALAVPEHGEGFWEHVAERLSAERSRDIPALPPRPTPFGPGGAATEVRTRPDMTETVGDLARHAQRVRTRESRARRFALTFLAIVVLGGMVALVLALSGEDRFVEQPAPSTTAADVAEQVGAALADVELVSGSVTNTVVGPDGAREVTTSRFAHHADGSYLVVPTGGGPAPTASYDATTGSSRTVRTAPGVDGTLMTTVVEEANQAAGPPDAAASDASFVAEAQTLALAALRTDPEAVLREERAPGSPMWVVDARIPGSGPAGPGAPDRVRVVVDQGLALPVEVVATAGGEPVWSMELSDVILNGAPPTGGFSLAVPFGAPLERTDDGFLRMPIEDVAAVTGTRAIRPQFLPDGFELAEVAVRPGPAMASFGTANPPSADVVSLAYRRGFEQVVVSTRRDQSVGQPWTDPFGPAGTPRPVVLDGGRFDGDDAQLVTSTDAGPHLWGAADDLVYTVAGDVAPATLVEIAESLS